MEFSQSIIDRVVARQGCLHPYDHFNAAETAFVVVDLQNFFTQPGYLGECKTARATFPAVNALAAALRQAGGHVIWIQTSADGAEKFWSHFQHNMLAPKNSARRLTELSESHDGFQIPDALDVAPSDTRVIKRYYSALSPGSSNLHDILQAKGVKNVLVGGTVTNVCCESTARNAMMLDYVTVMVHDTLSAITPQEHQASLEGWLLFFGDVLGSEEVIARLRAD